MSAILAFVRQDMLTQASYRVNMVLAMAGLVFTVIPLYFVSGALQPVMARAIATQGGRYFAFVLIGIVAFRFVSTGITTLPSAVGSGIRTGTLEMIFATPVSRSSMFLGMIGYKVLWSTAEALVLLLAGTLLGARLIGNHIPAAILVILLITAAYTAFGIFGSALLLAFRTSGPLPMLVSVGSIFFGGVYYPKHVIPAWLQHIATIVPLTYGLRALRGILLEGYSLTDVALDVTVLTLMAIALLVASCFAFEYAVRYAKRAGTLAQY